MTRIVKLTAASLAALAVIVPTSQADSARDGVLPDRVAHAKSLEKPTKLLTSKFQASFGELHFYARCAGGGRAQLSVFDSKGAGTAAEELRLPCDGAIRHFNSGVRPEQGDRFKARLAMFDGRSATASMSVWAFPAR